MKSFKTITFAILLSAAFNASNAQLKVWPGGGVTAGTIANSPTNKFEVNYGHILIKGDNNFTTAGSEAKLFFGDANHYIKSVFNSGVRIGTYGAPDAIVLQQGTGNVGIGCANANPRNKFDVGNQDNLGFSMLGSKALVYNFYYEGADKRNVGGYSAGIYFGSNMEFRVAGYNATAGSSISWISAMRIQSSDGKVAIGNITPSYKLDVDGIVRGYSFIMSDKRFKKDIKPLEQAVSLLSKLNGFSYKYDFTTVNPESKNELNNTTHFGFIAQELQKIFPELVNTDEKGYLSVDYISIIPLLVEAVKEQQKLIEEQNSKIESLEAKKGVASSNLGISNSIVAKLFQNNPNPFSRSTDIKCLIPNDSKKADIYVYDMQGTQIKNFQINNKGENIITIQGAELKAGMYMYSLIIDGQEVDTKRMILTNQ